MEDNSYRVLWEIDVDAASAEDAAQQALSSIIQGSARTFEIHQWNEPEMITTTPVTLINLRDTDHPEHILVPDQRTFPDQFMGPTVI
jgi:hypothetical protein